MSKATELADLYDSIAAEQASKGVKGEKAGMIREHLRNIVAAKAKQGQTELSQATLRQAVKKLMGEDAKLDQSYFSTLVNGMYETRKDTATGAVVVLTDHEKPPKAKKAKGE
jgi:hypothetical protein